MSIGATLRSYRKRRRWTLRDLAEKTGRDFTSLSKIENDREEPGRELLSTLAGLYRVSVRRLWAEAGRCKFCGARLRTG